LVGSAVVVGFRVTILVGSIVIVDVCGSHGVV
jgi:hypothetical protein